MITQFRFRSLTFFVLCTYIFWGSFGLDITLNPDALRFPLHRYFIALTVFVFLFNFQSVLMVCAKNKVLLLLIFYVLLTALWANNPSDILKTFTYLLAVTIITIMAALASVDNRVTLIRWMFWLFLLLVLASIAVGIYYPRVGINLVDFGKPRWIGITNHPNAMGVQGLVLIWLSVNLFFMCKSKLEKVIIMFGACAAFYAMIKADSMTSLITSLVLIGYGSYLYLFKRASISIKVGIVFVCILSAFFMTVFYISTSELTSVAAESTDRDTSFTGRSLLWKRSLASLSDHYVFGYGFDELEQLTRKYRLQMSHLHNGYVETLVKGGLVAILLLAILLIKTFINQLKIKDQKDFILLNTGLVMILLHNVTETSMLRGLSTLSILVTFIVVTTSVAAK
ncbi:O-antigen ligase family protein [Methylomonas sp. OY6]|uniref:O-antigen ligase family protein n=1 Tax=Methylomonas defluvii TaxID=3045149 RepID=A0ABU4UCU3_9GAMM|nr:O-antigen ligase family protein [Methylomonas sp. OY6]MDX8127149.1 O-antigen ligase family protein [Methylomonas sp. OY6]